jgi:8-oxo-dGTP diphosphatase
VLLHDPERHEFVLVEQLRIGLIDSAEDSPWVLELVAGMLDKPEDMEAMAKREVQEETGLQIEDAHYCGLLVDSSPTDYNWICFVYRASVDHFAPPDCNEGTLAWVPIESLATLPTPVTDPYLYPRVLSGQPFFLNALYSKENDLIELTEEISDTRLFPE